MKRTLLAVMALLLLFVVPAMAANDTTGRTMRIDTFGADVEIAEGYVSVISMVVTAYSSAKTVTFVDDDGNKALVVECPSGESITWPSTGKPIVFEGGLTFDDDASELASGDFIFFFLE